MNGADVWQLICGFLDIKSILKFRLLSRRHNELGLMLAKQKAIRINEYSLAQTFRHIMESIEMKAMVSDRATYHNDGAVTNKQGIPIDGEDDPGPFYYELCEFSTAFDGDNLCNDEKQLLPDNIYLDSVIYLEHDLVISNHYGVNEDSRGTVHYSIEFGDFNSCWDWKKGFMTIRQFADGLFRIKSHKFENWYELMEHLTPPPDQESKFYNERLGKLIGVAVADHGS